MFELRFPTTNFGQRLGKFRFWLRNMKILRPFHDDPCDANAGEAHLLYTISPRRDSVPGGHASQECMLACHVQVSSNHTNLEAQESTPERLSSEARLL